MSCDRSTSSTTLIDEVEDILGTDLQPKTMDCYATAVQQYREFMRMSKVNDQDPTEKAICEWVAYESLFIQPKSVAKMC